MKRHRGRTRKRKNSVTTTLLCVIVSDVSSCYLNVSFCCFCFVASERGAVLNEETTRGSFMIAYMTGNHYDKTTTTRNLLKGLEIAC